MFTWFFFLHFHLYKFKFDNFEHFYNLLPWFTQSCLYLKKFKLINKTELRKTFIKFVS